MSQVRKQMVAILDAGSQYGKRFDRALRGLQIESKLLPLDAPAAEVQEYGAVIITGSPGSVLAPDAPNVAPGTLALDLPMLGVCYGMQLMTHHFGGRVVQERRVDGQFPVQVDTACPLFEGVPSTTAVLLTHGDAVKEAADVPPGFECVATAESGVVVGIARPPLFGVQFHPEVDLTEAGGRILSNFLFRIAALKPIYTPSCRESLAIAHIRDCIAPHQHVLSMVSGGVDSSVCTALIVKALGADRIAALHIDNGFMRHEESATVAAALEAIGAHVTVVDASERFFAAVQGISHDPELKRKAIGDTFVRVANDEAKRLGLALEDVVLAQGTLRPDLIESASAIASSRACAIKTHHNDTDMVRALRDLGRVVEPLQDYHKDEVRELGTRLGLPERLVWRQPFPGPGLAIRVLHHHAAPSPPVSRAIDAGVQSLSLPPSFSHAVIPVRSVGVQGDARTYAYAVALAHASFHPGSSASVEWAEAALAAKRIPGTCSHINRVVFALKAVRTGHGSPFSFHSTETCLSRETVAQVRAADFIVNSVLLERGLTRRIAQMPVVLLPARVAEEVREKEREEKREEKRSVVLRPFITNDFMTGVPAIPGTDEMPFEALDEMVSKLYELPWVSCVLYDLTAKPPGTTEWE